MRSASPMRSACGWRLSQAATDRSRSSPVLRIAAPDDAARLRTGPATETVPDDRRAGQSATLITTTKDTMGDVQPLPSRQPRIEQLEPRRAPAASPGPNGQRPPAAEQKPLGAGRAPALTAGLDAQLQAHAEAAIQAFRSSFNAALAEGSPATQERLRQAASDLMRAAARTTIVLDRVNAGGKRRG